MDYHREAVVKEISLKEIKEIYQVIRNLDNMVMELLDFDDIKTEEVTNLEKIVAKMADAFHQRHSEKYIKLNTEFHEKIWSHNPNEFLHKNLQFCIIQIKRYSYLLNHLFQNPKSLKKSMSEHKEILKALKNKEKAKLKALALKHWVSPF